MSSLEYYYFKYARAYAALWELRQCVLLYFDSLMTASSPQCCGLVCDCGISWSQVVFGFANAILAKVLHQISLVVLIPSCSILAYAPMPYYAVSSVSVQFTCLKSDFFILFIRSVMKNQ